MIALIEPGHAESIGTAMKAGLVFEREVEMEGVGSVLYAVRKR